MVRRWAFVLALLGAVATSRPASAQPASAPPAPPAESVVAPAPLAPIEVTYPEGAHGDAEVTLEVLIAEDGSVVRSTLKSGVDPFAEVARRKVESTMFSPATKSGIPIRARIAVRISFREPAPPPPPAEAPSAEPPAGVPDGTPRSAKPPAPSEVSEVHVLGEQRVEIGSIHIPREEARRIPGAFGDPFRVAEVLPGVAPVLSGLPYFFVRGSPPGSVGYFIDGIRVPILFHVGPGPSVVTPLLIDRVDLFPGAYPSRFGRFGGAVFAGETLAPQDRSRAEGQVRIFDASAAVETPLGRDGRWNVLAGGRYSFTQAILAAVAPDYQLGYGDYQARVSYALTPEDRLSVLAFGGYDLLRNQERGRTVFDIGFHRVDLRYDKLFAGGRLRLATTLADDAIRTAPDDEGAISTVQRSTGGRLRLEFERDLGSAVRLRAGGDFGADRVRGDQERGDRGLRVFPDRTDLTGGAYADVLVRAARGVEVVPGLRFDQMRSRGQDFTFLEPRLGTRTRLFRGVSYLAGVGLAHQLPAWATRMPGRQPSFIEQSEQEVTQASQGIEYALPSGMLGRTTVFYQHIDVDRPGTVGRNYGAEQFLRRDFTKKLGGMLSYTLSRSEGQDNARTLLSNYDRTHVLSAVLGYDFGSGYRAGVRGYFASGRAFTVRCPTPDCGPGDPNVRPYRYEKNLRLPSFVRIDLRLEKRWTLPNHMWITGTFEWFNATLSTEPEEAFFTRSGIFVDRQTALTLPSIGVEVGW